MKNAACQCKRPAAKRIDGKGGEKFRDQFLRFFRPFPVFPEEQFGGDGNSDGAAGSGETGVLPGKLKRISLQAEAAKAAQGSKVAVSRLKLLQFMVVASRLRDEEPQPAQIDGVVKFKEG